MGAETLWREQHPGDIRRGPTVAPVDGDPTALLILGSGIPDRVRIPVSAPVYGGQERRVNGHGTEGCPMGCGASVVVLRLAGPGGLLVFCCPDHGFIVAQVNTAPPVPPEDCACWQGCAGEDDWHQHSDDPCPVHPDRPVDP